MLYISMLFNNFTDVWLISRGINEFPLRSRWKKACTYWSRGLTAVGRALCSGSSAACGPSTAAAYTNPLLNTCSTFLRGIQTNTFTHYLFQHPHRGDLIIVPVSHTSNLIYRNKTLQRETRALATVKYLPPRQGSKYFQLQSFLWYTYLCKLSIISVPESVMCIFLLQWSVITVCWMIKGS